MTSSEPFSRILESRSTSSWRAAIPAIVIVIAAVIAAAYFAAKASEQSQQLAGARTEMQQNTQAVSQLQSRTATLESDLARLRTAGRTTVILKPAASKASRKGAADTAPSSWGAATWGEQSDGKTWIRLDAYGLAQPPQAKAYQVWFEAADGNVVAAAKLDPAQDGSAFAEGKDLPAMDKGKRIFVSLDDEEAKKPGAAAGQSATPAKGAEGAAAKQQ
jgi:hypothetical protein